MSFNRQTGGAKNDGKNLFATRSPPWWLVNSAVVMCQPSRKNEVPNVTKPATVAPQRNRKTSQYPHPNGVQLGSHRLLRKRCLIFVQERAGDFKIILFHTYFIDDRLTTAFQVFGCRKDEQQAHFGIQSDGIEISSIFGIRSPLHP